MSGTRRRPLGLLIGVLMVIGVVALAVGALRGGGRRSPAPDVEPATAVFLEARDGVCAAAGLAGRGDVDGARTTFFDRSHQALHELAAAAGRSDRAATARLLEAKQRAEAGIEKAALSVADDLYELAVAAGQAIAAVGGADPGPCRR